MSVSKKKQKSLCLIWNKLNLFGFYNWHGLPIARFRVGQNIYIGASSADNLGTSNWNAAVTSWYDEVDDMTAAYVTSFP